MTRERGVSMSEGVTIRLRLCRKHGGTWNRKGFQFHADMLVRCPACIFAQRRMEKNVRLALEEAGISLPELREVGT